MLAHAQQYLASAKDNLAKLRTAVALDDARHAAEVAGKALFVRKTGSSLGKEHAIGGRLAQEGLIPIDVGPRELSRLLSLHTRGAYGFFDSIGAEEAQEAIHVAQAMLAAAETWPMGSFHPPIPQED